MQISERSISLWSKLGSRATLGLAMAELGKTIDDLMVLTADTSTSAGLERFKKTFPTKFMDVGIAEQNMVGIAAGLASEGFTVVTATFAPFQTMRCCEQIRVNLGYMQQKVTLVGLASGVVLGALGYTHCCVEDVAIMRAIPNIAVVSPADCAETAKALVAALQYPGSVYIRLTGGKDNPPVHLADYDFEIGRGIVLRQGDDVVIFATGTMVHVALEAAAILSQRSLAVCVVDMHTIKPIDTALIERLARRSKLLVTLEEHSIVGGLGSAVSEHTATLGHMPPQMFMGLPDAYGMTGAYADILDHYGLTPDKVAHAISQRMLS